MRSISTFKLAAKAKKGAAPPNAEEPVNSAFYGKLPGIGVADLLMFAHQRTVFFEIIHARARPLRKFGR